MKRLFGLVKLLLEGISMLGAYCRELVTHPTTTVQRLIGASDTVTRSAGGNNILDVDATGKALRVPLKLYRRLHTTINVAAMSISKKMQQAITTRAMTATFGGHGGSSNPMTPLLC